MKWLTTILVVVVLLVSTSPAQAQQAPPPPPGDRAPLDARKLSITSPADGSEIGVATVVEGTASPRATVELYIDGILEQRMQADTSGRFRAAVSGLEPDIMTLIEVCELGARGDVVASSSLVVRVVEDAPIPSPIPEVVQGPTSAPEPAPGRDPVISKDPAHDSSSAEEVEAPVGKFARGAISTGAGLFGGVAGLLIGSVLGWGIGLKLLDSPIVGLILLYIGGSTGYLVAMPLSVYLTGYLLDGDGSMILTILATYAGLVVSFGVLSLFVAALDSNQPWAFALLGGALIGGPAAGAIVFELTSNPSRRAAKRGVSMTPLVAPTADGRGAVVGLGGTW